MDPQQEHSGMTEVGHPRFFLSGIHSLKKRHPRSFQSGIQEKNMDPRQDYKGTWIPARRSRE